MAQNLDLNVNVNTDQAAKSVGSLKTQLKQAQAEVVALSDKFGATSVEAVNAAKKAAELRDRIGDARALTEAFNPDQKFRALTQSLSGVAGGFAAVQGAMSLFGSESEDLQKTLVKVQSAMALSQGLEAVGNSIDAFKNLGTVIRTQVIAAFSTLRGAIIATGVGALAVGVGLLIANFEKVKQVINDLFPSLGEFADKVKLIVQGFTDFIGVTSEAKRNADALTEATNAYIKSADRIIRELESQNGKEKEIYDAKRDRIQKQLSLIKGATAAELQAIADLNTEIKILDNQEAKRKQKISDDAEAARKKTEAERKQKIADDAEAARKKELQELKDSEKETMLVLLSEREAEEFKINEHYSRLLFLASKYNQDDSQIKEAHKLELNKISDKYLKKEQEDERAIAFQRIQDLITDIDYENSLLDFDFEQDQQRLANKEAYIAEQKRIELSNLDLKEKERLDIISKYAKQEQDIEKEVTASKKAEMDAKTAMQLQYLDFVGQFGNLLSQIAGKNKDIAIMGLLIEKGAAIAKIITQMATVPATVAIPLPPYVLPNPAFIPSRIGGALSIASVIAASVQGIQQIKQAGSGGTASSSVPSMSTQAPMIPQLPTPQTTNISRQSINDLGNQAVRAYVIETDVTGNQQRMAAIKQRARFS